MWQRRQAGHRLEIDRKFGCGAVANVACFFLKFALRGCNRRLARLDGAARQLPVGMTFVEAGAFHADQQNPPLVVDRYDDARGQWTVDGPTIARPVQGVEVAVVFRLGPHPPTPANAAPAATRVAAEQTKAQPAPN